MKVSPFKKRVEKVLSIMKKNQISCMLVTPSSDLKYLCGYSVNGDERFLALILCPGREPFMIANSLYELQVTDTPITEFIYWQDGENPFELLKQALITRQIETNRIALSSSMPVLFSLPLMDLWENASFINASNYIQPLRIYKDRAEMDAIIAATSKAEQSLKAIMDKGTYWIGKTEEDLLAEFRFEMTKRGLKNADACVASGANAACPHHSTGPSLIEPGKCLLIDFGATYENYYSDMTRTFFFGKPDERFCRIYDIVLDACLAGENAAKAGNQLQDVDTAARNVITKAGYGDYFIHRTGHGIGIDYHEGPSAGPGEQFPISPGMVFSCEPGIYLPGEFGVRIEDQIMIEEDGSTKILHSFPKNLIIID